MRQQPPQQPPPAQRLRIRYAKRGRLRFTSHRDFSRAFERAVARARLPVSYSSGFHPHPRISYAGAAPTGSASEAEYLEIALASEQDPTDIVARLDAALPEGLDIVDVVVARSGSLTERLEASRWQVSVPGLPLAAAEHAVEKFLASDEVLVERMTKKGLRTFDTRAAVQTLTASSEPGREEMCAILEVVLRHGTPSVRPDDVLAGLRDIAGLQVDFAPLHERVAQGPWDVETGTLGDPLAPDRDTA